MADLKRRRGTMVYNVCPAGKDGNGYCFIVALVLIQAFGISFTGELSVAQHMMSGR